ncbi:DUF1109 domain-containing protein [Sphingomonas sp. 28-62-11]|uniref:DUF1109 domain-containing protein n=1 Tax=Sphingomonas sp. 28-62-11 TaxID=1970432 RepID=UPI000BDBBCDB|nr:MAG: hypothetical protein B7Y49_12315 [Sphingomonas sp. 28-62-11]
MRTEDLIQSLSADTRAIPRHADRRRVLMGLLVGSLATLAVVVFGMGLRQDLPGAMMTMPFMMKWAYSISLGVLALVATLHVARPDAPPLRTAWIVVLPVALLMLAAIAELATARDDVWMALWMGSSWRECSMRVALLSLPIFAGLIWAFRQLAPTRLRTAGAAAGLAAGGCAATLYGLHCPEVSATFVVTWYTLGMVLSAAVGALLGPRLLRW